VVTLILAGFVLGVALVIATGSAPR
jgi:hypothetical protein